MKELTLWLQRFGLHETAIEVYLCIANHPHARTADIQKHTQLVRTSIYYSLADLKSRGLVSENLQNNIRTYHANDPEALRTDITKAMREQETLLEDLDHVSTMFQSTRPVELRPSLVSRYEGDIAIKQAINLAMRCSSKKWHVIASHDNYLSHTTSQYKKYYVEERVRRNIIAKTLWEPHDGMKTPSVKDTVFRNPKVLPDNFRGTFDSLIIIYDDTVLFVSPYDQKTAHSVQDSATAQTLRMMFAAIWQDAPPARALTAS